MNARLLCVAAAGLLLAAADKPDDATKKDMEAIQGKWTAQNLVLKEDLDAPGKGSPVAFTFDGDKLKVLDMKITFKLDATMNTSTIDLSEDGNVSYSCQGIYELDGDSLKLAYAIGGHWPKEFKSTTEVSIIKLKRDKK